MKKERNKGQKNVNLSGQPHRTACNERVIINAVKVLRARTTSLKKQNDTISLVPFIDAVRGISSHSFCKQRVKTSNHNILPL